MRDGERTIRFGEGSAAEAPDLLAQSGFGKYALLTTERAEGSAPLDQAATQVVHVPPGLVDEISATLLGDLMEVPLVALGGGRVIDTAKAIGGVTGLPVAAIPTTLSGAELTPFHRTPAGVEGAHMVRPSLVVADPLLMASQPATELAASAMNALAHGMEALYTPLANPIAERAALRGAELIADDEPALGALLCGWASGIDRLRGASRHLPAPGAHGRLAARPDERGDAAALRRHDGRPRARRDGGAGGRSRRPGRRPRGSRRPRRKAVRTQRPHAPLHTRRGGAAPAARGGRGDAAPGTGQHARPAGRGRTARATARTRSDR